jgi:hypothetical protein
MLWMSLELKIMFKDVMVQLISFYFIIKGFKIQDCLRLSIARKSFEGT